MEVIAPVSSEQGRVSSSSDASEDREGGGGGGSSSDGGGGSHSESKLNQKAYRDCSQLPPVDHKDKPGDTASQSQLAQKDPTFPIKLHMILSNPAYEEIISWLPHGRSWRITQQKNFEEKIIPLYFRHGRYSSFARQVNGWGFNRVMQGSDYNSYYHELFLRGLPHLCERMRRLTPKDVASRKTENVVAPDFYALSRDHPLPDAAVCPMAHQPIQHPPAIAAAVAAAAAAAQGAGQFDQFGPILAELEMLEKRRREIVERIAVLTRTQDPGGKGVPVPVAPGLTDSTNIHAGLSNSNTSGTDAIRSILASLGHQGGGDASSRSQPVLGSGDNVSSLLQQAGLIALAQHPGGAQLVAQIVQANNPNVSKPSAPLPPVPTPDASALTALLMMPGGLQLLQQIASKASQPAPQAPPPPAPSNVQMLQLLMRSINGASGAPSQQASVPLAAPSSPSLTLSPTTAPTYGTQTNAASGPGMSNAVAMQQSTLLQMLMQAQQQHAQAAGQMSQANNQVKNASCSSPQNAPQQMKQTNDDDNASSHSPSPPQQKLMPQVSNAVGGQQQQPPPQNAPPNAFLQQQMSGGNAAQQAAFLQMLSAAQHAAQQQHQNQNKISAPSNSGPEANVQRQFLEAQQLMQSGTNLASLLAMSNKSNSTSQATAGNNNNIGQEQNKGPGN